MCKYFGDISFLAEHIRGVCCTIVHVEENSKGLSICLILHIGKKIVNQSIHIYILAGIPGVARVNIIPPWSTPRDGYDLHNA